MHEGHRQRMLTRLIRDGDGLQEHELLEILLFNAIPRKNTNDIAHKLLDMFGSLEAIMSADFHQLMQVDGIGESTAAYLKCIALVFQQVKSAPISRMGLFSTQKFSDFLKERYAHLCYEVIDVFCLDPHGNVRRGKQYTSADSTKVTVPPEDVSRFIISNSPYAIVVAHNHVGTVNRPSVQDDEFTAQMQMLCSINNIYFYDHIIIGSDGYFSYHLTGRMEKIKNHFSVDHLISERLP